MLFADKRKMLVKGNVVMWYGRGFNKSVRCLYQDQNRIDGVCMGTGVGRCM